MSSINVLFVCLGNICRSPLAEGAFRAALKARGLEQFFRVDSAGTGAWHVGETPDPRSIQTAATHNVDITTQRARVFVQQDMERFDYIFAMDRSNQDDILRRHTSGTSDKVHLYLTINNTNVTEVPDPYYGGTDGFEHVWSLVSDATSLWLDRICAEHHLTN